MLNSRLARGRRTAARPPPPPTIAAESSGASVTRKPVNVFGTCDTPASSVMVPPTSTPDTGVSATVTSSPVTISDWIAIFGSPLPLSARATMVYLPGVTFG